MLNQLRSMEYLGRCLKHVYVISVIVLIVHVNGGLSLAYRHANVTTRCVEREKEALLAIKRDLVDEYDLLSSWGDAQSQQDCCTWKGVHCHNRTGHVVQLRLGALLDADGYIYHQLQGTLSPKLAELHHLTYLDLSHNDFNGSQIPAFIGSLTNLRYLDLYDAGFGGEIPYHQLGNLTHLQYLNLGNNYYYYTHVENLNWLPNLSSLKYLELSWTNLSKASNWVETINKLSNLRNLTLVDCELPPPILSTLSHHINSSNSLVKVVWSGNPDVSSSILIKWLSNYNTTLVYLDLSGNDFNGSQIPAFIGTLTNLRYLDLFGNSFTPAVENLNWLSRLSSLKYLDLTYMNLSKVSDWLESVNNLPNLRNLTLRHCDLPPPILSTISHINSSNSLARVDLIGNPGVTSSILLKWLSNFNTTIVHLDLSYTELSGMIPDVISNMSSLAHLDLSGNQISGGLFPNVFRNMSSLIYLDLSYNPLGGGGFPKSIGQLCSLQYLAISNCSMGGQLSEFVQSMLTCAQNSLEILDLYSNNLTGSIPSLSNFLSLKVLYLDGNQLSGMIPESIGNLSSLKSFHLSNNRLSGVIPESMGQLLLLVVLDLSGNNLSGWLPEAIGKMSSLERLYLSGNQLEGPVPSYLLSHVLQILDLSNNKFAEMISFICVPKVQRSYLVLLDLSNNNIAGEFPDCLGNFINLILLDLSNNMIYGKIPSTLGSLFRMETLKLRSNRFEGELPSSLKNCTSLQFIDLGDNNHSRTVPAWLGVSFPNLGILILQSNQFSGSLPAQLCHLTRVQILDFSMNQISGTIPKCIYNLTSLAQVGSYNEYTTHSFAQVGISFEYIRHSSFYEMNRSYPDDATLMMKGRKSSYQSILGFVKSIDLSTNKLTGEIPIEITRLVGLISLNLSRNHLTGHITSEIGNLQSLESLDLSRNQLDGGIPKSLARVDRLAYLDLSYNHLSGEIPTGTQLQSFEPSAYAGNPQLCGLPLEKCVPQDNQQDRQNVSSDEFITQGFFISMGLGFASGFWGVCGSLMFKRSWRYAYYKFLNALYDWLYVRVALVRRQLKDMVHRID